MIRKEFDKKHRMDDRDTLLFELYERVEKLEALAHKKGVLSEGEVIVTVNDSPQGGGGAC